jgi:hypothetical protein
LDYNIDCPTYPLKPFSITDSILIKNIEHFKKNLKQYLYYSFCDSIKPNYRIPILDHSVKYSLSDFYPMKFMDCNISSDKGLYDILQFLNQKKNIDKYQIILVDVGIFWRYYKWVYNPNNRIPGSRSTAVVLGFWHTYKELATLIYQRSIKYLFGPILGKLFSNSSILLKPKLGHIETYFNWFMLVFPLIKEKLYDGITNSSDSTRNILKNIRFLFESAIPFVCFFTINNFENFKNY